MLLCETTCNSPLLVFSFSNKKMSIFPQLVVGTYEEFLLGYNPKYENEKNINCELHQSFATHSHQASVRCVAAYNNLMASSGADEYINIYDMVAMQVSTVINYHDSTVTCLEFTPDGSHLVTANQNGDIVIFQCKDWTLVKLWKKAHCSANGVTSISIHPSGSLLLTTGADNIVRFWNLVKGRQAYATNFSKKCSVGNSLNFGMWLKNGKYYAVCVGNILDIYKTKTAALIYEVTVSVKITCSDFIKKNLICLGTEDGSLEIHSFSEKKILKRKKAHKNRVKSLSSFYVKVCKKDKNINKNYIVSADSRGEIKLWYFKKKGLNYSLLLRGEVNCDCRITCLTLVFSQELKKEKNSNNLTNNSEQPNKMQDVKECVQDKEISIVNCQKPTDPVAEKTENKLQKLKRKLTENNGPFLNLQNGKRLKNEVGAITFNQNSGLPKKKTQFLKKKKSSFKEVSEKGFKKSSKNLKRLKNKF